MALQCCLLISAIRKTYKNLIRVSSCYMPPAQDIPFFHNAVKRVDAFPLPTRHTQGLPSASFPVVPVITILLMTKSEVKAFTTQNGEETYSWERACCPSKGFNFEPYFSPHKICDHYYPNNHPSRTCSMHGDLWHLLIWRSFLAIAIHLPASSHGGRAIYL